MIIAALAQGLQEFCGGMVETTFTLNRLDNNSRDPIRLDIAHKQIIKGLQGFFNRDAVISIGEGRMVDLARERTEADLVRLNLARKPHCQVGTAMKTALEGNNARASGV